MPLDPIEITGGLAIGEGLGGAIADTVEPRLQKFKNSQWAAHQDKPLDPADAAAAEQQGYTGNLSGITDASYAGIDGDRYLALRFLAATAPGTPELLELWRRGKLSEDLVRVGLKKAGLMDEFVDAVLELFTGRLDPAVIATAIQRGIMRDPGFLPVGPPTAAGKVPAFPVSPLDPVEEAKAHGIDADRLFVETAIVGLPLALVQAAQAYFRGIIEETDFDRAVSEGNTRNEWRNAALEVSRQILTAGEYTELQLRGFSTADERRADTAKHGMTPEDSDKLYNVLGRAPTAHAIVQGLARGAKYPSTYADVPEPFRSAIQRSNIREEFADIVYHDRFSFPSGFQVRAETNNGDLTAAETEELLLEIGWMPKWAAFFAEKWAKPAAAKANPWIGKADTQLWTATHKGYKGGSVSVAQAQASFDLIGIDAASQTAVLERWDAEKAL